MTLDELVARVLATGERAYAPYSSFKVGVALLGKSGRVYTGCNVENAAYGPSACAETSATPQLATCCRMASHLST